MSDSWSEEGAEGPNPARAIATSSAEARFRAAIDGSLDAFFVLSCDCGESGEIFDFIFADLNVKGAAMLGLPREEILGRRLCELRPVNRTNGFFDRYVRVFETKEVLEEESFVPSPSGDHKWVHHQVVPLPDGVAITSRDVTRYRKLENELRDALKAAEATQAELEESHRRLEIELFQRARAEAVLVQQQHEIQSLSVPIVEAWSGVLALPLIGSLDDSRSDQIMDRLLDAIGRTNARFVIIDLTAVALVTAHSVEQLVAIGRAAALLGSQCLLSGISGTVARALLDSGVEATGLSTFARMRDALAFALRHGVRGEGAKR